MDRRNFLRTGSLAMLGSLAVPSLAMPASSTPAAFSEEATLISLP